MSDPKIPSLVKLLIEFAVESWRKGHRVRAHAFAESAITAWRSQGKA